MTTFDRIEPRLPELIDELAAASVPDYFDDMLRATAQAKQRPAWSSLERWLPMGVIARPLPTPQVPWRLLAIAAALVIVIAGIVAYAGSRARVPAPFGPAANGSMFFHDADGVIYAGDPVLGSVKAVVSDALAFSYPVPSRDGRQIVYDHTQAGSTRLFVANADGSNAHPLPGTYEGFTWTDWSPDDRQIGIVSMVEGVQAISILEADGSAVRTLPLDREVLTFWWLPDGGFVFTGAELPGDTCRPEAPANRCALLVVRDTGRDSRIVVPAADFMGLSTSLSPDGRSVLIDRWGPGEPGRLHLVDLETGADSPVPMDNLEPDENSNIAELSPDGSQILFDRYQFGQDHFAVMPTAGGTAINLGPTWPQPRDGVGPEAHWSPDGTTVVAFIPGLDPTLDELWLLDATGRGDDRMLELPVAYAPAWQRVAP